MRVITFTLFRKLSVKTKIILTTSVVHDDGCYCERPAERQIILNDDN